MYKYNTNHFDWHKRFKQQAVWTEQIRSHLAAKLSFNNASNILEVGSGTGVITGWLQNISCNNVYGLDIDVNHVTFAHTCDPKTRFTSADVYHCPFPSQTFDITLCHYFLLWMANPIKALSEIRRITKKGGLIIALAEPDYGGRIDYPEKLSGIGLLQIKSLQNAGADPLIGRKLGYIFNEIQLTKIHVGLLGGEWYKPPSLEDINLEWSVISNDLRNQVSEKEVQELKLIDIESWNNGERILYVPTFYAWGQKE